MNKILEYIKIGIKVIGQSLRYIYAPYIMLGTLSLLFGIIVSWLLGIIFLVITILLTINEVNLTKELELDNQTKSV